MDVSTKLKLMGVDVASMQKLLVDTELERLSIA